MARPLRVEFPGALYLVTARVLPRQRLIRDPEEGEDFIARLPVLGEALGAVCHGFCLLPDHYHLLLETPRGNLSRVLHRLNAGYTATLNARRKRRGPLLQSRYRSLLIDENPWLVSLSSHIHLNPVRKRLSRDPWSYPWSSASAFVPGANSLPGVRTDRVLALAGGADAYVRQVEGALPNPPPPPWKEVWRGVVLGGDALRGRALDAIAGKDPREIAGFSRGGDAVPLQRVIEAVAANTGVRPEEIVRSKFQRLVARKMAIYLARQLTGLTLREIGEAFGVDYTTVHMATRRFGEMRTRDSGIDELVSVLEDELRVGNVESHAEPEGRRQPPPKRKRKPAATPKQQESPQLKLF
jgi:REP element-mobilizing transposase RayT